MNFIEAMRTGLPLQRPDKSWSIRLDNLSDREKWALPGWVDPQMLLSECMLTREDVLAEDWEVKRPKIEVDRITVIKAFGEAHAKWLSSSPQNFGQSTTSLLDLLLKGLGL